MVVPSLWLCHLGGPPCLVHVEAVLYIILEVFISLQIFLFLEFSFFLVVILFKSLDRIYISLVWVRFHLKIYFVDKMLKLNIIYH